MGEVPQAREDYKRFRVHGLRYTFTDLVHAATVLDRRPGGEAGGDRRRPPTGAAEPIPADAGEDGTGGGTRFEHTGSASSWPRAFALLRR